MKCLPLSEIAEQVRAAVDESRRTQSDIAEELGVSQPAVSGALQGEKRYRQTLFRVARLMGFKVEERPRYRFGQR